MNAEIGDRIRSILARDPEVSSQRELAARADMTPDALSRALSGSRGFAITELVRIAGVLGTSSHWLATGDDDPYALRVAARHEFDSATMTHDALNWEPARARLEDIALAYEQVQAADWPPATTSRPTVSPRGRDAGSARAALVECAGDGFVRCFADSIEATFGIDVVRLDRLTGGYSLSVAGRTVIVVSDTSNWFYQNWSLAHELGHIVQGTMEPLDDPDRDVAARERRANAFAADLLLPRPLMRTVEWKSASPDEIALFVWQSGVSTRTLVNRLKSLRYRIPDRVEVLLGSSTQTLLRSHARLLPAPIGLEVTARMRAAAQRRFPLSLLAAHREAVAQGRMHTHTLAWMLGADPEALERELAPGRTEAGNQVADLAHLLGFES